MIQPQRLRPLNDRPARAGDYILYWMQASQRAECNHALEYAVRRADEFRLPVVVFFGLTGRFPEAQERHYVFLLEGLAETRAALERKGIKLVVRAVPPDEGAVEMSRRATLAVTDRGYLRIQKVWQARAAAGMPCRLVQVESDAVVPVETASSKEEWSAATLRPKLRSLWPEFLIPLRERRPRRDSLAFEFPSLDPEDIDGVLKGLRARRTARRTPHFRGGASEARSRLRRFLRSGLDRYADSRNDPNEDAVSHLSPYLHFGQISPLQVALRVRDAERPGGEAFLEELLVRRELSLNFVHYNPAYDAYAGLPDWARRTLAAHARDKRPAVYSEAALEAAATHDPYWNAAQREMAVTGKMHGYMRMYWGKKILEWSRTPEEAFLTALRLNNVFELDGRDPNAFAGVAWCFGKHDRPWGTRPIFGQVRYMNDNGLRRKFDADAYVRKIEALGP